MTYPKLFVKWNERESASYYINQITAGWNKSKLEYWLKSFSGIYTFNTKTRAVTLDTGTEIRNIEVMEWSIEN